ncbi:MAG: shikimate dehydrogenase [Candidatus Nanopelagicales bacterium]
MTLHAAVLGSPIEHSLSPVLHRAAYAALGLDCSYEAIEMTVDRMPDFLASLDSDWIGLSLTMPLKESVQPLLTGVEEMAELTASVNTIYRAKSGWAGANTDVFGIERAFGEIGVTVAGSARILGAGATARSAVAAMIGLGVESLVVCARRAEQARDIARLAEAHGIKAEISNLDPVPVIEDILVSVLPGDVAREWATASINPRSALLDASYHPWPSALASAWPNVSVASGRDMLLWQATRQVHLMTGQPAPVDAMREALRGI